MDQAEFQTKLRENFQVPLLAEVGFRKFHHVERLGAEEVEGILDGDDVIVQTKIDGTNVSISNYESRGLVIASRNNVVYTDKKSTRKFYGVQEYVLCHDGIREVVYTNDWVLRGEFSIRHTVLYDVSTYGHYYVFDVQNKVDHSYVHPDEWIPVLQKYGVKYVPIAKRLKHPSVEEVRALVAGPDEFGATQKEGIVIKRYDGWKNAFGQIVWAKLINAEFREANKLVFGASQGDPPELRFVSKYVTDQFVLKTIHTIEDQKGRKLVIQDMSEAVGRVWYDLFTEELWNFIKKEKVSTFDFKVAQKMCVDKTRNTVLAYVNGIPSILVR